MMNTSNVTEEHYSLTYVSCIEIDGQPILPPVMTESRRAEMRQYREQAVTRERLRNNVTYLKHNQQSQSSLISLGVHNMNKATLTSTPSSKNQSKDSFEESPIYENINITMSEPEQEFPSNTIAKESRGFDFDNHFVLNKQRVQQTNTMPSSESASISVSTVSYDYRSDYDKENNEFDIGSRLIRISHSTDEVESGHEEEMESGGDEGSESGSGGGHFASIGSSTGTFIIQTGKRNEDQNLDSGDTADCERSDGEVASSNGDEYGQGDHGDLNTTVIEIGTVALKKPVARREGSEEPIYKRKRPACYFESDDYSSFSSTSHSDTITSNASTSLGKFMAATVTVSPKNTTFTATPLENLVNVTPNAFTNTFIIKENTPINTDFAKIAAAALGSQNRICRVPSTTRSRKALFSSPNSSAIEKDTSLVFNLSTNIPSSAETSPPIKIEAPREVQEYFLSDSDGSNKENHDFKKKHVRKLSYTLPSPSPALLLATSGGTINNLSPLPSAPSSVGIPSVIATPEKPKNNFKQEPSTPTCQELDARLDHLNQTLHKLQQLNLGKGKKAHLERFLGEQNTIDINTNIPTVSTEPKLNELDIEQRFKSMEEQHQKQLQDMIEMYRQQEIKMIQEFEKEKVRLLQSVIPNAVPSNVSFVSVHNNVQRSPLQETMSTTYANFSPVKVNPSLPAFSRPTTSGSSISAQHHNQVSHTMTSNNFTLNNEDSTVTGSCNVISAGMLMSTLSMSDSVASSGGLSRLQARMQALSPNYFKVPADARSPLLKGLIFPDPLDKPKAPLRIPPEVYDPLLKPKFMRLTATVKGYLTRRLLHTEKIQIIIQTIRDTVELILKLHEEVPTGEKFIVRPQDSDLHRRLIQQLNGACSSFHDVFFKLSTAERMAIIANDREKIKLKAIKNVMARNQPSSPAKRNISTATLRCLERRMSQSRSPPKKDYHHKKIRTSMSIPMSQSVKGKPSKSYISPKRRRVSYWDRDAISGSKKLVRTSTTAADLNGNKWKPIEANRKSTVLTATRGTKERAIMGQTGNSNNNSGRSHMDTFVVPQYSQSRPITGQTHPSSSSYSSSSRFSIGIGDHSGNVSGRSSRRVPWKD